jgi:hypothetical protein
MRRLSVAFVVVLVVVGCGGVVVSSPPSQSSAAPASSLTFEPVATHVKAPPTATPCPTESPMSVATYTAADPACFGPNDVTLTGWEDIPSGIGGPEGEDHTEPGWLVENNPTPSIIVDRLPAQCPGPEEICGPWLFVHVDPASKLSFEADGIYVVITGHRHDPQASTCTRYPLSSQSPVPTVGNAASDCVNAFVLTSVREVAAPALSICPTDLALSPYTYGADPACFHGRNLRIRGWTDSGPAIYDPVPINPRWLVPTSGLALWSQPPVITNGEGACPPDGFTCGWMWLQVAPASGVVVPTHRWVILTGHIDDPAAETCRFTSGGSAGGPPPPAVYARQDCRSSFVVTKVEVTTAPG